MQTGLVSLKRDYRYLHVAYGELRGLRRDQIEKPRPTTEVLDGYRLNKIKAAYAGSDWYEKIA